MPSERPPPVEGIFCRKPLLWKASAVGGCPCGRMPAIPQAPIREQELSPTRHKNQTIRAFLPSTPAHRVTP